MDNQMTKEQKELAKMLKGERDRIYNLLATNKTQTSLNHACAQHAELNRIVTNMSEILKVDQIEFMRACGITE